MTGDTTVPGGGTGAATYAVTVPDGEERGVTIECTEHEVSEEFQPGYRSVAFYCAGCGREVEVTLRVEDWRDTGEMC